MRRGARRCGAHREVWVIPRWSSGIEPGEFEDIVCAPCARSALQCARFAQRRGERRMMPNIELGERETNPALDEPHALECPLDRDWIGLEKQRVMQGGE